MAALVIASCDGTEVLQPIDRSLDDIAAFVSFGIESWRRSTPCALAQSALLRVEAFGTNTAYPTVLDLPSIMACAVGAVDAQA